MFCRYVPSLEEARTLFQPTPLTEWISAVALEASAIHLLCTLKPLSPGADQGSTRLSANLNPAGDKETIGDLDS